MGAQGWGAKTGKRKDGGAKTGKRKDGGKRGKGLLSLVQRKGEVVSNWLAYPEVAELLGVSRNTVSRWAQCGFIPSVRIGQVRRIPRKAFLEWFQHFQHYKVEGTNDEGKHTA